MAFFQSIISSVARTISDLIGVAPVGEYSATPPTLTDGQAVNLQVDSAGNLKVASAGTAALPTGAATEAKQDTQTTALGTLHTDLATTVAGKQDTGNTTLSTINGKLPASLGAKTGAASLSVTLPSDYSPLKVSAPETAPVAIRTFSGTVADTAAPLDAAAWVAMAGAAYAGFLDISLAITSVGGTASPTQVTFQVWNRVGGSGGSIKKIDEFTVDATKLVLSALTNPYTRRHVPCNAADVYVTVTFPDGTAPTITGVVSGRAVAVAGLQRRDLIFNPDTQHPVVETRGYDSSSDSVKTSPTVLECDLALPEALVVDTTAVANGTYYYPSADGVLMGIYGSICWEYDVTGANGGTVTISMQATNGSSSWTSPKDVTLSAWESSLGTASSATIATAANGTKSGAFHYDLSAEHSCNWERMRMKVVVADGASGAIKLSLRRRVR
jgi:hypothetical protein